MHTRNGRPPGYESERRRRHFAELIATDVAAGNEPSPVHRHAATARLKPDRALKLLADQRFRDLVETIATSLESAAA